MRILIDALSARVGGGVTYITHILPALASLQTEHDILVLYSPRYQQSLIDSVPMGVQVITVDLPAEPLYRRWWFLQTGLISLIKDYHIDLFYAPGESSYLRIPIPFVITAGNLSIYATPSTSGRQKLASIKYRLSRQLPVFLSLQRADRITFLSNSSSTQIIPLMHLNVEKTRIVYFGVSPIFLKPSVFPNDLPTSAPYYLMVSSIGPHKNYDTLLKGYSRLPDTAPHLLIAGKAADKPTYDTLQAIVQENNLQGRVHFLGEVSYDKLPGLYQGAVASVFASRLETFGHPLVEAMASQTPVIASNLPICQEICQGAALYFDPDDEQALAEHLWLVWQDETVRTRLRAAGQQRAANFSWQKSAQQLVNVFEELR